MAQNGTNGASAGHGEEVWIRLQIPRDVHQALKDGAKGEGRNLPDFVARLMKDVLTGNFTIGHPAPAAAGEYDVRKPSEQPLPTYAKGARELILAGTTLRSIQPFQPFLESEADKGTSLNFLLVSEDFLREQPSVLEQVAARHGTDPEEVLHQLTSTREFLQALGLRFPRNVKVKELDVLPGFGLTIVDPGLPSARMRVSLYLYRNPRECNPALHIQPSTSESKETFGLFLNHYMRCLADGAPLELPNRSPAQSA